MAGKDKHWSGQEREVWLKTTFGLRRRETQEERKKNAR
jgi:hypothetical protein